MSEPNQPLPVVHCYHFRFKYVYIVKSKHDISGTGSGRVKWTAKFMLFCHVAVLRNWKGFVSPFLQVTNTVGRLSVQIFFFFKKMRVVARPWNKIFFK